MRRHHTSKTKNGIINQLTFISLTQFDNSISFSQSVYWASECNIEYDFILKQENAMNENDFLMAAAGWDKKFPKKWYKIVKEKLSKIEFCYFREIIYGFILYNNVR